MILLNKFISQYTDIFTYAKHKNIDIWHYYGDADAMYYCINYIGLFDKKNYSCGLSSIMGDYVLYIQGQLGLGLDFDYLDNQRSLLVDNIKICNILMDRNLYSKYKDTISFSNRIALLYDFY